MSDLFPVGSRVVVTEARFAFPAELVGKVGVVREVFDGIGCRIYYGDAGTWSMTTDYIRAADNVARTSHKFRGGDRVRVTCVDGWDALKGIAVGDVGTVVRDDVGATIRGVEIDGKPNISLPGAPHALFISQLELIPRSPAAADPAATPTPAASPAATPTPAASPAATPTPTPAPLPLKFSKGDKVRIIGPSNLGGDKYASGIGEIKDVRPGNFSPYLVAGDPPLNPFGMLYPESSVAALDDATTPPDDGLDDIREAIHDALDTASPASVLAVAKELGIRVEQQTRYVMTTS